MRMEILSPEGALAIDGKVSANLVTLEFRMNEALFFTIACQPNEWRKLMAMIERANEAAEALAKPL